MSGVGEKRRSRFEDKVDEPDQKRPAFDVSAVAARAAEMSRELSSKVRIINFFQSKSEIRKISIYNYTQIAMVTSQLNSANAAGLLKAPAGVGVTGEQTNEKRPVYRALVLDAQGITRMIYN